MSIYLSEKVKIYLAKELISKIRYSTLYCGNIVAMFRAMRKSGINSAHKKNK